MTTMMTTAAAAAGTKSNTRTKEASKESEGRHHCHAAVNDIIHRTLVAAHVLRLEPPGLLRSDGKRPDGVTVVPWWKASCVGCHLSGYFFPFLLKPCHTS